MPDKAVRLLRAQSILGELIGEAIASLGDERLSSLIVLHVECSRGLSDATVYLMDDGFDKDERQRRISALKKSSSYIARYCTSTDAIARMPKLSFAFDDSYAKDERLAKIFDGIKHDN